MRYGIRCDFFFVGKAVMDYGALAKEIVAAGHRAGNHSFTHRNLLLCSKQRIGTEIERATEVIARATGKTVVNFRPPFGYFDYRTLSMASRLKKNIIMWTIDAGDFQAVSVHTITKRIRKKLQPGSIILLHDNHLTEKRIPELLPRVIDSILEAGLSISPLPA
jgi:peptidoglycan/xylan/chitin deacetylase (PgdA/CDA1 family)